MVKISFIIPCFNSQSNLLKCFNSLTGQTFSDIEFIFVDDGSTDSTSEVIRNYMLTESRAKLIIQKNQGITKARLSGIENATGEYVAFLDSDDYIDVTVAQDAVDLFNASADVDAVIYSIAYVNGADVKYFNYSMNFPVNGFDIFKYSIPSWRISTMGFYRHAKAFNAYSNLRLNAINSNEIATRLIFESCDKVQRTKSFYYYVHNGDSVTKTPSKNYVTRLEGARWLREYSIENLSSHVHRADSDKLYINQLCEMFYKYRVFAEKIDKKTKSFWLDNLYLHRGNILNILKSSILIYPVRMLFNINTLIKIIYIIFWPVVNFTRKLFVVWR